jgi:hypothetical protein
MDRRKPAGSVQCVALAAPAAAVAAILWAACPARAIDGTPFWITSTVAAPSADSYVSSPVLAFDHFGLPAVAWSDVHQLSDFGAVKHSQLLGLGIWHTQTVQSGNNIGRRTALAFDRAERPILAWVNNDGSVQGQFNYGAVQSVAASSAANTTRPTIGLSYDLAGNLRGFFGGAATGNFRAIGHSGTAFSTADMMSLSNITTVHDAVMTTDGQGRRHFAARGNLTGGGQGLVIASEPPGGGSWPSITHIAADAVSGVDIARDPTDGRIALAYSTFDSQTSVSTLHYAKFTGSLLDVQPVDTSMVDRFFDVSLAFDPTDGRPAVAYERFVTGDPDPQQLHFSWRDAASLWQHSVVDETIRHDGFGNSARRPHLAFDTHGTGWPAIAYVDGDFSLAVAFDPPAPEPATATLLALVAAASLTNARSRRLAIRRH